MQKPKISFVCPTYNRVAFLGECIQSLREQTIKEIEIIVVDDGSKDETDDLMNHFLGEDKRIKYISFPKHKGVASARNAGNKLATSDIICVCDDDDLYHPKRADITLKFFKKYPRIDIMNGSYVECDIYGNAVEEYIAEPLDKKKLLDKYQTYFCHDCSAYKRKKILKTPYRDAPETDDWALCHDWIKMGYKFGITKKVLCKVKGLPGGIMDLRRKVMYGTG